MTTDPNDARSIDAKVAEVVFGVEVVHLGAMIGYGTDACEWVNKHRGIYRNVPLYSTSPADAHRVIEKMEADGWSWRIECSSTGEKSASFRKGTTIGLAVHDEFSLAVCRAVLDAKAKEADAIAALSARNGATV